MGPALVSTLCALLQGGRLDVDVDGGTWVLLSSGRVTVSEDSGETWCSLGEGSRASSVFLVPDAVILDRGKDIVRVGRDGAELEPSLPGHFALCRQGGKLFARGYRWLPPGNPYPNKRFSTPILRDERFVGLLVEVGSAEHPWRVVWEAPGVNLLVAGFDRVNGRWWVFSGDQRLLSFCDLGEAGAGSAEPREDVLFPSDLPWPQMFEWFSFCDDVVLFGGQGHNSDPYVYAIRDGQVSVYTDGGWSSERFIRYWPLSIDDRDAVQLRFVGVLNGPDRAEWWSPRHFENMCEFESVIVRVKLSADGRPLVFDDQDTLWIMERDGARSSYSLRSLAAR